MILRTVAGFVFATVAPAAQGGNQTDMTGGGPAALGQWLKDAAP